MIATCSGERIDLLSYPNDSDVTNRASVMDEEGTHLALTVRSALRLACRTVVAHPWTSFTISSHTELDRRLYLTAVIDAALEITMTTDDLGSTSETNGERNNAD
jgi:hypothetical protein